MPSVCMECAGMVTCPECGNREVQGQPCSWCRALAEVATLRAKVSMLEASVAFERCTVAELRLGVYRSDRRVELAERERAELCAQLAAVTAERDEALALLPKRERLLAEIRGEIADAENGGE